MGLIVEEKIKRKRFEALWLEEDRFADMVQSWWESFGVGVSIGNKLEQLSHLLMGWNKEKVGDILDRKKELSAEINHFSILSESRPLSKSERSLVEEASSKLQRKGF